ncbi:TonB-dependent receptor [Desulfobacula toluolica]|uniref:TonB-dependent receptor n=1 Tax=Desulfobacula toluolica (strain DSM 7467 / Tol2) TaxID=651182 RepID=K0NC72_DESTT|nr:TonB-dependent receptor [Desulfobacula toluolica]CCK78220.1 TonB-dependent receptor [Desulfobacula toluolica Tol2]
MKQFYRCMIAMLIAMMWGTNVHGKNLESKDDFQLESIVVTAQKREENAQNVPVSMDVFSGTDIEDAGMEKTNDLVRMSSNVNMMDRSCEHIVVIRGISPFRGCTYSPAGFYVDDASYPMHYMQNIDLFDLERAEILKGPQSTLYGRNSESGVINIVTRQPDNEFNGQILTEYASQNTFRTGLSLKGPMIKDTLYLGGAFQYKSSDGHLENLSTGDESAADISHLAGRFTLRWTPGDLWDISLTADAADADDHGAGGRLLYGNHATGKNKIKSDCDAYLNQDWNGQTLRIKYYAPAFTFLSVSGIQNQSLDKVNDCDMWDDPSNQRINPLYMDERHYSQEFRISSIKNGSFEWLAGFFAFREESFFDYKYEILSANMVYMNPVTDVETEGAAIFGQGRYTPFDRLHLTAGLRLDYHTTEGYLQDSVQNRDYDGELSYHKILPKLSLDYDLSEHVMAYTSAAKGYMPGGFNWGNTGTRETFDYGPEYTWNYEMGVKSTWLNQRLMVNLSAFYIQMEDKQVSQLHPTLAVLTISNAANAHSKGVELQIEARPIQGLDFFAGLGVNRAVYDDFTTVVREGSALIEKDYSGNYLTYAPKYTFNLGFQYRSSMGLFGRVDLLGTGPFYGDSANTARQGAYEIVNLRLGYEWRNFEFTLWGKNILDKEYMTFINPFLNSIVGIDGPSRSLGATIAYRF